MKSVQVGVFKAELSEILYEVKEHGESFIIEYGKSHKKVAMLVPYQPSLEVQVPREFGYLKPRASCVIHDDFEMTDDEFIAHE